MRSGQFILGPEVEAFEKEFASWTGARFGIGVASGTDALELALRALGIGPGDAVLTVSFTFLATASAIRKVGAKPVFVDVDPRTCTMDLRHLTEVLKRMPAPQAKRIKAILPVHLYGHPCDMPAIGRLARKKGWKIVEDCAQAHGAAWNGKRVGTFGDLGCFSFYPTKNLGGCGDGGMVVTSSPALARRLKILRFQGRPDKERQVLDGLNSRLDELQAALLRVKLTRLNGWLAARRRLASCYTRLLRDLPLTLPAETARARHVYHLYVVQSPMRDLLRKALLRQGIPSAIHYPFPVHRQSFYRENAGPLKLPVTERLARQVLSLPLFPEMKPSELKRVAAAVRAFYRFKPKPL
ncbi:MAG: DegT/DnrJ/EryC1/StrS family aminotransferase [Candidatus Omnitrophica bacterium]|nr:DegT/DnrJ/EryC1/StrS family aminotransferase [Candidatus Omnitrophota bacterium]